MILNGRHFNAKTGQAVTAKLGAKVVPSIDGILPKHIKAVDLQKASAATQPLKSIVKKPVMDMARRPATSLPKRALQPGQTLMRRALAKPLASPKRQTKVTASNRTDALVVLANLVPKTSAAIVDSKKFQHAQIIAKSSLISRFSVGTTVQAAASNLSTTASRAVVASQQAVHGLAKQPSLDIFERALAHANGHEQKTPAHVKKSLKQARKGQRRLNVAASALALLLLAGFIGYQQLPNMKFQYASSQAGFHAALPGYQPAGFSLGKLSYQAGAVSVKFHSNSDDRAFALTQKASGWDSQALRDNFVASSGQSYHTAEAGGRTIYIYGNDNATWVNAGVWYQVQSGGSLNERQLTQLAASM